MKMTVYTVSGAPRAWRVLLGLAFKGLEYQINYLQVSKGELKSPEFLAINPRATVPVLDADGLVLRDSIAILAWLDKQFPNRPLFGKNPEAAAAIWQITTESCDYLRAAANEVLFPILVKGKALPAADTEARAEFDKAAEALHRECALLEQHLQGQPYFGGEGVSAADAVIYPEMKIIERAISRKPEIMHALGFGRFATDYPHIEAWRREIDTLDGVDKTQPIHWAE